MKHYSVITEWDKVSDNLNPAKIRTYPKFKGDIEVIAINREVAEMAVLVDHVDLGETIEEISAKDIEGTKLLPKSGIPYLGYMNYIAN